MKQKPLLSQTELKRLLDYNPDTGKFTRRPIPELTAHHKMLNTRFANKEPGCAKKNGYITIMIKKQPCLAHRLAWLWYYGVDPGNRKVDHINNIISDNRITNLRLVQNKSNNSQIMVKVRGVHKTIEGKWYAMIMANRTIYRSGLFDTEQEAIKAYNQLSMRYHYKS